MGEVKVFDFSTVYDDGICTKLKDISYFKRFTLDPFSVDWNNGIGFAPEFLYAGGHGTSGHDEAPKTASGMRQMRKL